MSKAVHIADDYPIKQAYDRKSHRRMGVCVKNLAMALSLLMVTACANQASSPQEYNESKAKGTITGMVVGSVVGYSLIGKGTGQILSSMALGGIGAGLGYNIASNLSSWDRDSLRKATYESLAEVPTAEPTYWESSYSGNHGKILPRRSFVNDQGRLCREYETQAVINGRPHSGVEAACLTDNGQWEIYGLSGS